MKKQLTYQQRLLYVLIAGGIFSIVLYNMAIADTVNLAIENADLEQQIAKSQDAPQQIQHLKKKLQQIEQLVGNTDETDIDIHQVLLEAVTGYVQQHGLVLKDFPRPYETIDKGYITKTAKVTVEGDFINLLKLVYFLENNYKVGKVVALDFMATKELRTQKRRLNTIIYLQNVKAQDHEENS